MQHKVTGKFYWKINYHSNDITPKLSHFISLKLGKNSFNETNIDLNYINFKSFGNNFRLGLSMASNIKLDRFIC